MQAIFYFDRAELKMEIGDIKGACIDWVSAKNKGFDISEYDSIINEYCNSFNSDN